MEALFAPTTRLRDVCRATRERDCYLMVPEGIMNQLINLDHLVELELVTASSAEDTFLHCGFTWSDFYSWARGKIVWISPDVFFDLSRVNTRFQTDYGSFLSVHAVPNEEDTSEEEDTSGEEDTSEESEFVVVYASSEAHATVVSDILLQLLITCDSRKVG
jgi:hypothetical protein